MTATATRALELLEDEREEVCEPRPHGEAPKQAHQETDVRTSTTGLGLRVHDVTVLFVIVAAQVAWLSALGYAAFRMLT